MKRRRPPRGGAIVDPLAQPSPDCPHVRLREDLSEQSIATWNSDDLPISCFCEPKKIKAWELACSKPARHQSVGFQRPNCPEMLSCRQGACRHLHQWRAYSKINSGFWTQLCSSQVLPERSSTMRAAMLKPAVRWTAPIQFIAHGRHGQQW